MRKPGPLIAIFLTVFIDMLSFGMAIPDIQLRGERLGATGPLLGLLLAIYSIAQLFTTPYLGQLSDRIGRRKVLLVTSALTVFCFLLYANATTLALLFAARILAGISGANIGVAFAYIADITTPQERAKSMGMVGAAFGLGFIFGPPVGANLVSLGGGQPTLLGYTAATLGVINLWFIWKFLPESLKPENRKLTEDGTPALKANFLAVGRALRTPGLSILVLLFFGSTFAFSNLESTFFRLLDSRHGMNERDGAYVLMWVGVVAAFMQGYFIRVLTPKFGEVRLMRFGYWLQVPVLASIPFAPPWIPLLLGALLLGIATGVASPSTSSLISRSAPSSLQGSIFGVTQSVGAFGRILGPLCGSTLFEIDSALPYFAAALIMLIPACLALRLQMPEDVEASPHPS